MKTGMMIESANRLFYALLDDIEDGVAVSLWQRALPLGDDQPAKLLQRETFDAPWHLVADKVSDLVESLKYEMHILGSGK